MKKLALSLILCLAIISSIAAQSKAEWKPLVFLDNQIYPSFLLATANMKENFGSSPYYNPRNPYYVGSTNSPIGLYIVNPKKKSEITLSIKVDGFAEVQNFTAVLPEKDKVYLVFPPVIWNWDKLRNLRQPTPANITYNLTINGKSEPTQNVVGTVRSVNEALLGYVKPISKEWIDTTFVLTAYVNEDHPWIDQVLKEALEMGLVNQFDGYQSRDASQVLNQIGAIWTVLQKRGFRYSSITETSNASRQVFTQTVRLFEDSINASQANCVDGTALMAAILTKIGIEAYMVTIPGHCFLAFKLNPKESHVGLETTMMGAVNLRNMPLDQMKKVSAQSFINAVKSGMKTFGENQSKFAAANLQGYSVMKIEHARKLFNIAPITR